MFFCVQKKWTLLQTFFQQKYKTFIEDIDFHVEDLCVAYITSYVCAIHIILYYLLHQIFK